MPAAMPANAVRRLQLVAAIACGQAEPDEALGQWFAEGLRRHVREGVALDVALALRSGRDNGRTPRVQLLLEERNALLREALHLAGSHEALAGAINVYETRVPATARARVEPDPAWPAVRQLLHRAAHLAGARLPASERQLRRATRGHEIPVLMSDNLMESPTS